MKTTIMPICVCTACGYTPDRATGDGSPFQGDVSICGRCGNIAVFDDELRLRAPTDKERGEISADPEVQRFIQAITSTRMTRDN